jgi:hypothetical protein
MSLTIVVNGGGTFTASMEEGPVSFTASLAAVGPQGPDGAAGPGVAVGGATGQVLAKASGTDYDTEWVARNPFNQELNTTDSVSFQNINAGVGDFSDISIGGSINYLGGSINFSDNTSQSTALPSGTADGYIVSWDEDTATYLSVPNDARTLFITARNITGTTIPKGSVVLITGASGNRPTIGLAQADTGANADGVIGITDAAIDNNANGRVITEGLADNLDTSAFAAGDKLFLSAVTPGGLVNVRPVQPAHSVAVGVVTRSNNAVGSIEVKIQVGEHLEFLHDVLLTSNTNLDLLSYETSSGLWKNKSFSTLGLLTSATAASTYAAIASTNTFTANQIISVTDNSNAALRVTQLGTGEAFRVEDSANPDSTPFVITADGRVGIATTSVGTNALTVSGATSLVGATSISTSGSTPLTVSVTNTASGVTGQKIDYRGTGDAFLIANNTAEKFVVDKDGNTEIAGTLNVLTAPAAGNSSTLIPTTAWVQAEVPAASTTAAGKVELATDAEAVAGTSATLAVTPSGVLAVALNPEVLCFFAPLYTGATSGTGAAAQAVQGNQRVTAPTTAVGYAYRNHNIANAMLGRNHETGQINFDKRIVWKFRSASMRTITDSNTVGRILLGKNSGVVAGDPTTRSIGVRFSGGSNLELLVHDGTNLTAVSTSFSISTALVFECMIVSEGDGTVTLFVNGVQEATTNNGPTGNSASSPDMRVEAENLDTITTNGVQVYLSNAKIRFTP